MLLTKIILLNILFLVVYSQVSRVVKQNPLLLRKKRYLIFPMDSNFVISMSYIKALMIVQPTGWMSLGECDFPFPLPSDTRSYKKLQRKHFLKKRQIAARVEAAFNRIFEDLVVCPNGHPAAKFGHSVIMNWTSGGFNGTACVQRLLCEAQQYVSLEGKSMVKDILWAVILYVKDELFVRLEETCNELTLSDCEVPFLSYILGSILPST